MVLACPAASTPPLSSPPPLPEVTVEIVRDEHAGGSFTRCAIGVVEGKKVFLKSSRGNPRGTRYANFEADILAWKIFERLGMKCPGARVVRLVSGTALQRDLGRVVLAMDFVDTRWAGGRVYHGQWPGPERARSEEFVNMALVDVLMGNADRREANFFVMVSYDQKEGAEGPGSIRPVPIDNNCGFSSMVNWSMPSNQLNFVPSYKGLAPTEAFRDMGTIRNVVMDSLPLWTILGEPKLTKTLLAQAAKVCARLDDGFIDGIVDALPREILPDGVVLDPGVEWVKTLPESVQTALFPFEQPLCGAKLWAHRVQELKCTLKWRRDQLPRALAAYLAWRATDPEQIKQDKDAGLRR